MFASRTLKPCISMKSALLPAPAPRRQLVVVAIKPTKAADFRGLSDTEIMAKIGSVKQELSEARYLKEALQSQHKKIKPVLPPNAAENMPPQHIFRHLRRQVAQLWTILRERQLEQGINKRQSRKISKKLERRMVRQQSQSGHASESIKSNV